VLYPAIRKGRKGEGTFKRVTWDKRSSSWSKIPAGEGRPRRRVDPALLVRRLERTPHAGQHRRAGLAPFGTSRLARTVCAAPTGAANMALYGKMPSVTYQDYPKRS
jgi:anaerobic selenocysteine-containing dehydrogenase